MNNFAVITKAEQDVAKAKAHLSVLKQKINDSKAKLEDAKKDYDDNINTVSSDNSGIHEYILSVDLIKVELNKAEASLLSLNDEINNAKEASKKASEVHSAAKQKTIEMGDRFYNIKKKADTFKDSISKVEENLNAKKAIGIANINFVIVMLMLLFSFLIFQNLSLHFTYCAIFKIVKGFLNFFTRTQKKNHQQLTVLFLILNEIPYTHTRRIPRS